MSATRKLEEEFLRLEQGNMTVQEYTTKFMEKARFTEIYVPTEERRIEKYVWGLRSNIREFVMTRNPLTFEATIDVAELTEREKNRYVVERAGDKRKWDGSKFDSRSAKSGKSDYRSGQKFSEKPCVKCNQVHLGDCAGDSHECHRCRKVGHMAGFCPT